MSAAHDLRLQAGAIPPGHANGSLVLRAAPDLRLLAEIQAAGLSVDSPGAGRVRVAPAERLTPELRARIVASKPALLSALALARRIRAMGDRWQYTAEDLTYALEDAQARSETWLACCEWDEQIHDKARRAGMRWPH